MEPTPNQVPPQQPISSFTPPQNIPQANMTPEHHEHKSIGPIVGSLIIVILIVAAGIYIWGQKLNNEDRNDILENGTTTTTDQSQTQQTQVQTSGTQQTSSTTSQPSVDASIEQGLDADFGELDDMNF